MEPEIARRCPACGASVRGGSFFCPQCGRPFKAETVGAARAAEGPEAPASRKPDAELNPQLLATMPGKPEPGVAVEEEKGAPEVADQTPAPTEGAAAPVDEAEPGPKRRSIKAAAREAVGEKISPRVEKLRQASNVMLEEASYDPSVRFVLIAVAILIISALLFFLNRFLG